MISRRRYPDLKVFRRGSIDKGGAYFSSPGFSTYSDSESEGVESYLLKDAKIADTSKPEVRKEIIVEALKDKSLKEEEKVRLVKLLKEESINYIDNDELPLPAAAKRLGYDGIKVWENDDVADPTSIFLWSVDKAKKVSK